MNGNGLSVDPSDYSHLALGQQGVIQYSYTVQHGNGGSVSQTAMITINGLNAAPVISGVNPGPLLYRQDQPALPITPTAEVADPDSTGFEGSQLVVEPLATPQNGDRWLLRTTSDLTLSGGSVAVDGVTIGTHTGGTAGDPLVVSFNSSAALAAVRATLRAVAFIHDGSAPDETALQEVAITLRGGGFVDSDPAQVSVTKWDRADRPVINDLGAGVHFVEGLAPVTLADPAATVFDPDEHPDFAGAKLTAPTRSTMERAP